jgi:formylglycine-generating enzyme required for sulfatase activity
MRTSPGLKIFFSLVFLLVVACSSSSPTATTLGIGSTMTRERDGAVVIYVPGGQFETGSTDAAIDAVLEQCEQMRGSGECERWWFEHESPPYSVTLDNFWIDKYEVTNAQYALCVEAGSCDAPTTCDWGEPTYGDATKEDHPVVCVDWYNAQAYCEWTGVRLPTEAE